MIFEIWNINELFTLSLIKIVLAVFSHLLLRDR